VRVLQSAAWLDSVAPQAKFADVLLDADVTMVADAGSRPRETISPSDAEHLVRGSDLVVVMDRWVGRVVSDGTVVLLLSNLAYANERLAAEQPGWDSIWVPSDYLAAQVLALSGSAVTDVCVVQPVIASHTCAGECPVVVGRPGVRLKDLGRRRLVFPHRLDVGKGLLDAVDLLALLAARDPEWTLIVTAGSGHAEPGKTELVSETFRRVTQFSLSDNFKVVPWLPQPHMACLYASSDVTLIGSTLPEGFGLVLYESLAVGVPVVTTPSGNLGHASRQADGVWAVSKLASEAGMEAVYAAYGRGVDSRTRQAVQHRYSWSAQREALKQALGMPRSVEE
jgi:glycosyltransferase involved in cell wall biosynthesis